MILWILGLHVTLMLIGNKHVFSYQCKNNIYTQSTKVNGTIYYFQEPVPLSK